MTKQQLNKGEKEHIVRIIKSEVNFPELLADLDSKHRKFVDAAIKHMEEQWLKPDEVKTLEKHGYMQKDTSFPIFLMCSDSESYERVRIFKNRNWENKPYKENDNDPKFYVPETANSYYASTTGVLTFKKGSDLHKLKEEVRKASQVNSEAESRIHVKYETVMANLKKWEKIVEAIPLLKSFESKIFPNENANIVLLGETDLEKAIRFTQEDSKQRMKAA